MTPIIVSFGELINRLKVLQEVLNIKVVTSANRLPILAIGVTHVQAAQTTRLAQRTF